MTSIRTWRTIAADTTDGLTFKLEFMEDYTHLVIEWANGELAECFPIASEDMEKLAALFIEGVKAK